MSDRLINHLSATLQPIARQWKAKCDAVGLTVSIIVTWRSPAEQSKAKADGLSNADIGQSPHNCCTPDGQPASRAFDFGVFASDGHYITDGTDARYKEAGEIGKNLGLVWGGDWKAPHKPDWDHLELAHWKTA